ncbi:MAG: VWA-like domain-containing protein [Pseudomonadota bacterium]|nr:VWA-like domain-containing protein [Pseudomonadota bacterium]
MTVENKLAAARTRLILDKPFLGALVLRMPLKEGEAKWCPTTATDARAIYYNPDYIESLNLSQTEFALAHEALHCALAHFARRQHRDRKRWDLACDFAVNPLLVDAGLRPSPDALLLDEYRGLAAEEIYPLLDDNPEQETQDRHLYNEQERSDSGEGEGDKDWQRQPDDSKGGKNTRGSQPPPPLDPRERARLETQWRQRLASAAQQAQQAGKLDEGMARLVDHLLQPALPWRALLARYMNLRGRDDFNYARPSRRSGEAILPALRSVQIDVCVFVDTSGSVSDGEIAEFLSEINAIKGQVAARIILHACDSELATEGPWVFEPWEEITLPQKIAGGGGTSFLPPFAWLREQGLHPELVIYFTDAEGAFPGQAPPAPVLWLVKGRGRVPWGERIQLN